MQLGSVFLQPLLQCKAINVTYSKCNFAALDIQHAMHVHHTTSTSLVCPAVQYFSTCSHKRRDLEKKKRY